MNRLLLVPLIDNRADLSSKLLLQAPNNWVLFRPSATHTTCPWKGVASYYDVAVGDSVNRDAAWYYPEPSKAAERVRDRIAFWRGVKVDEVEG